ncbi:ABC transporter substrate-binding protein [Microbacterium phosphatis]|uniref:ABC transporter substrate-binding protein n=1 Tax=Microbacterium phosphatis TaxID=3140248 RepID=UPI0031409FE5
MVRSKKLLGIAALGAVAALTLAGCAAGTTEKPAAEASKPAAGGDLALKVGMLAPSSGSLSFLGPPQILGVQYAQSLVNEYSDKTGLEIEVVLGDEGDTDNKAYETELPKILGEDVSALIGAASSAVSKQIIDTVTGAGIVQVSTSNTGAFFTTYEDNGLYFRTAPSDVLQGDVLGNFIAEQGAQTLGLIVMNDDYGTGLAGFVTDAFEAAGGEVVAAPTFNPGDTSFDAQISEVLAAKPDAVAVISFAQAATIIPALNEKGFDSSNLYLVDGNVADYTSAGDNPLPAGVLTGAKGTIPGPTPEQVASFNEKLKAFATEQGEDLKSFTYGPEAFDALTVVALASLASGSTDGKDIAAKLQEVTGGSGDGEKCETFADCADLLLDGKTIDYDGASSEIKFDDNGDPEGGYINLYEYADDNTFAPFEG